MITPMIGTRAAWLQGGCGLGAGGCSLSCTREPEQVQRRSKALCLVEALLVAENATEQAEWQACLQTVATAYRNWRRVNDAPGAMLGGLKIAASQIRRRRLRLAGGSRRRPRLLALHRAVTAALATSL